MSPDIFNYRESLAWAAAHLSVLYLILFAACVVVAIKLKDKVYSRLQRLHPKEYGKLEWSRSVLENQRPREGLEEGKLTGEFIDAWRIDMAFFHNPQFLRLRDPMLNLFMGLHLFAEIICLILFISMIISIENK